MDKLNLPTCFSVSGLPRSALAAFLMMDNATVSRLADGRRSWRGAELKKALAFFGIVPDGYGHLVRKLRRREVRALLGPILAARLANDGHSQAFGISLHSLSEGAVEIRADQIVAICGKFEVDLAHLLEGRGVRFRAWPGAQASIVNYDEARDQDAKPPGNIDDSSPARGLPLVDPRPYDFQRPADRIRMCEQMVVMNDRLEPRYRRGETIYIDTSRRECRHGDDVVVSLADDAPVVIGRLMANRGEGVLIEDSNGETVTVTSDRILEIRRISFVEK